MYHDLFQTTNPYFVLGTILIIATCYFPNVECPTPSDEGRSGDSLSIRIGLRSLVPVQNQQWTVNR